MELIMKKSKETPGTIVYKDEDGHSIYLKKAEVNALGNPAEIKLTIDKNA